MDSPLKYDEGIIKKFGIKAELDLEDIGKLTFARNYLDEVKKLLWRERQELILSETQAKVNEGALQAKALTEIESHLSNLKGIYASIETLTKLVHELEAKVS